MPNRSESALRDVVLVYKKSKLDLYVNERHNPRYTQLAEAGDERLRPLEEAHEAHQRSLAAMRSALERLDVRFRTVYRAQLRADAVRGKTVVTLGGDGTVLDASRKATDAVVLGVNSDPSHSVGFLCAANAQGFEELYERMLDGSLSPTPVARLFGEIDGKPLPGPVLNDLLLAQKNPAATVRYAVTHRGQTESHKSSGVWVAGPAGSTAAIASAGGVVQDLADDRLQYRVREPFAADGPMPALVGGLVDADETLVFQSRMREGRLYLDGPHQIVSFPFGATLTLHGRGPPLRLIVTDAMRGRRAFVTARHAPPPKP